MFNDLSAICVTFWLIPISKYRQQRNRNAIFQCTFFQFDYLLCLSANLYVIGATLMHVLTAIKRRCNILSLIKVSHAVCRCYLTHIYILSVIGISNYKSNGLRLILKISNNKLYSCYGCV